MLSSVLVATTFSCQLSSTTVAFHNSRYSTSDCIDIDVFIILIESNFVLQLNIILYASGNIIYACIYTSYLNISINYKQQIIDFSINGVSSENRLRSQRTPITVQN